MPEKQQTKKGKARRVSKAKIAQYWLVHYSPNMLRRVIRVYRHVLKFKLRKVKNDADRIRAELDAGTQAKRCASAHGAAVEGGLARWLRGEPAFKDVKVMKGQSVMYRQTL